MGFEFRVWPAVFWALALVLLFFKEPQEPKSPVFWFDLSGVLAGLLG